MKDLQRFGTEDFPLHPSMLYSLLSCPWKVVMRYIEVHPDEHGEAGDTGSAMHAAAAAWHKGAQPSEALQEMHSRVSEYPKADLADAAALFLAYAGDSRQFVRTVLVEQPIAFSISPAPQDKTQTSIQVIGTLDQVREHEDGKLRLWDIKTSRKDGYELLQKHSLQAAAYCIGASILLDRPVHPGGLILPRKYREPLSTSPVFWLFTWSYKDIEQMMQAVRYRVAEIRNGQLYHRPGECDWCHARSPDFCFPKLQETLKLL